MYTCTSIVCLGIVSYVDAYIHMHVHVRHYAVSKQFLTNFYDAEVPVMYTYNVHVHVHVYTMYMYVYTVHLYIARYTYLISTCTILNVHVHSRCFSPVLSSGLFYGSPRCAVAGYFETLSPEQQPCIPGTCITIYIYMYTCPCKFCTYLYRYMYMYMYMYIVCTTIQLLKSRCT